MNKPSVPIATERALLARLRELLAEINWPSEISDAAPRKMDRGFDAVVRLKPSEGKSVVFLVECKTDLRPSNFPTWARDRTDHAAKRQALPLLGMPHVSDRLAELCRNSGWSWFDLAGNCRIDAPGRLHIERAGPPPVHEVPRPAANLGTAAAARVLRVLLSPSHAQRSWTQRDLQIHTCGELAGDAPVSIGLVNKVVRHLRDEGFVTARAGGGIQLRDAPRLLAAWKQAYRFGHHHRRSYFTLLKGSALAQALYTVGLGAADVAIYASFSAAERQAPHVRQPKTWVYVGAQHLDALVERTAAKEVDSGENLVILVPEDSGVFLSFSPDSYVGEQTIGCTDPAQTYVDLAHSGGRGEEAAQALLDQRLLPAWTTAGVA